LCKGSSQEPYKVRVDLRTNGYACTCPSRKFPCKHVLGLLLLAATSPKNLAEAAPPGWVSEWLEKRAAHSQAEPKRAEPKADLQSRQKEAARRAARRENLAETGVAALERWLKDFARLGLAYAQAAPASFWNDQAARMVDCQLPGAARMIREMQSLPGSRPDWAEILLLRLGRLYLLVQAFRKQNELPEAVQQDVRALLGWTVNQDELVAASPGVRDDWLVLAARTDQDEKTGLLARVSWLWGRTSKRPAQILNYAPRGQSLDASLVPGLVLRGELVYSRRLSFTGQYSRRSRRLKAFVPSGFDRLTRFFNEYAAALERTPGWSVSGSCLEVFPSVRDNLAAAHPQPGGPASDQFASAGSCWLSGGRTLAVFGLWDGLSLTANDSLGGRKNCQPGASQSGGIVSIM
jgi:hypothetical protein